MTEKAAHQPFTERRQDQRDAILVMVEQIHSDVGQLRDELKDSVIAQKIALSAVLSDAFPDGDADGHRRHHEAVIKAAEERAVFWKTMRVKLSEWGLIGFGGWALYAIWGAFLQGPHK